MPNFTLIGASCSPSRVKNCKFDQISDLGDYYIHPFTDKSEIWQERAMVCSFLPKFHLGCQWFVSPTRREKNLIVFSNSAIWGTIPKLSVAEVRTFLCTHRHQTRHFYSNGLMTNFDHKVVRLYRSKAWRIKAKFHYTICFEPASNQIA